MCVKETQTNIQIERDRLTDKNSEGREVDRERETDR